MILISSRMNAALSILTGAALGHFADVGIVLPAMVLEGVYVGPVLGHWLTVGLGGVCLAGIYLLVARSPLALDADFALNGAFLGMSRYYLPTLLATADWVAKPFLEGWAEFWVYAYRDAGGGLGLKKPKD